MTNSTQKIRVTTALLGVLVVAGASPVHAGQLFKQPTATPSVAYSSQTDTSGIYGDFATVYDNFTLGVGATMTDVSWVGSYFAGSSSGISGFTIAFYADDAGQPGAVLMTENIAGNADETSIGDDPAVHLTFSYSATLSTTFIAAAGTQYWLSIVPDLRFPSQWGWESGIGGDGLSYQDFLGDRTSLAVDFAFSLDGAYLSTVPEPGTLTSACTAVLMGLGYTLRRRRRPAA